MKSWSDVPVPSLEKRGLGNGTPIRIFDVAQRDIATVNPQQTARMYVCGITPYDATHIGHAATYVAFDLVQRLWLDQGLTVSYTQNVTDVDDPLLERAKQSGVDWLELARSQVDLFREDMAALRVLPPTDFIGAVESIDLVIEMISRLSEAGATYYVDNDLYFRVHTDRRFGSLSDLDAATMRTVFAERGGDPERSGKEDPLDCLLWKAEVPGEPAWDSPMGRGRPGWHIECAAIAQNYLGTNFDIQGGGSDLVFPHHEMSASQGRVATNKEFAQAFVHSGMVALDGDKMSKSQGNLELVSRLRSRGVDPMAIRLAILSNHYRQDWEWFDATLTSAQNRLNLWREAVSRDSGPPVGDCIASIRLALTNDLDSPAALNAVDHWAKSGGEDSQSPAAMEAVIDALLGVSLK